MLYIQDCTSCVKLEAKTKVDSFDFQHDEVADNPDPHFEPLVSLPAVEIKTLEEEEEELLNL